MHWHRKDYLDHLCCNSPVGREMFVELFGLLVGVDEEWRSQGASKDEITLTAFDWDYVEKILLQVDYGPRNGFKESVIEETSKLRISLDRWGRRVRLPKAQATIPLPETYPMTGATGWDQVKPWLAPHPDRIDWESIENAKRRQPEGAVVRIAMPGAYATLRELMGDEEACLAFFDEPDLVADVMQTLGDMTEAAHHEIARHVTPDELAVHEDFAGKSGPLIGPNHFNQFIAPYYRRLWSFREGRGVKLFDIDSDGFIEPVIDALLGAGINSMHPLEPAAGVDIVRIRKRYGRHLVLRGGIDKLVLAKGSSSIRQELEYKMQDCMRGGGIMFGLDHRIPTGTPLAAYREYVRLGREILGLPPIRSTGGSWARMA